MKKMTEENVKAAFAGESQAHMRYLAFAEKAEAEKFPNLARAFRANALAEQVHAFSHLKSLSGLRASKDNVVEAAGGEGFEVDEMYPAYIVVAQAQGEKVAEFNMKAALEAEKVHRRIYQEAGPVIASGRDIPFKTIHVCLQCGFTVEGDAPDKCGACGSGRDKFVTF
jgi:rubrerythrin